MFLSLWNNSKTFSCIINVPIQRLIYHICSIQFNMVEYEMKYRCYSPHTSWLRNSCHIIIEKQIHNTCVLLFINQELTMDIHDIQSFKSKSTIVVKLLSQYVQQQTRTKWYATCLCKMRKHKKIYIYQGSEMVRYGIMAEKYESERK